jgi:hypothetical protein
MFRKRSSKIDTTAGPEDVMVRAAGPGHWNDPDMLVIGNPGLSLSEQQAHFAFWAIFAAPLTIAVDLRTMPEESREILLNTEIIVVNQDPLGRQGWCADKNEPDNTRVRVRGFYSSNKESSAPGDSDSWAVLLENHNTIFNKKSITFDPKKTCTQWCILDILFGSGLGGTQGYGCFRGPSRHGRSG